MVVQLFEKQEKHTAIGSTACYVNIFFQLNFHLWVVFNKYAV